MHLALLISLKLVFMKMELNLWYLHILFPNMNVHTGVFCAVTLYDGIAVELLTTDYLSGVSGIQIMEAPEQVGNSSIFTQILGTKIHYALGVFI